MSFQTTKENLSLVLQALRETKEMKEEYLITIPLTFLLVGALPIEPYIYKLVLDTIVQNQFTSVDRSFFETIHSIFIPLLPVILLWAGASILSIWTKYYRNARLHYHLSQNWAKIISLGIDAFLAKNTYFHLSTNNAEKLKIFNRWVDAVYDIAWNSMLRVPKASLLLLWYVGLWLYIRADLTFAILSALCLFIVLPIWLGNKAHTHQKFATKLWDRVYAVTGDFITNQAVIALFGRRKFAVEESWESVISAARQQHTVRYLWGILDALQTSIEMIIGFIVLLFCTYFFAKWLISFGDIILFLTIAGRISGPFMELETAYRELGKLSADYAKYREVLDIPPEEDNGTKIFPEKYEQISFQGLSFQYPNTKRSVIKDLHLFLKRGTKTALVGHTGSGKSTIANLLSRFYEPSKGGIYIDDTNIRDISLSSYRSQFAAVFQDTTLFNDTISYNLKFIRDGISDAMMKSACRDANILDFIESLPEGFDTVVGERGLKLSGGEKQRIAIARAILADPEILILDEATSALDTKTERLVTNALERLMEGRTSLIIAHRLSTIKWADQIFLLRDGKIMHQWTHVSLYRDSLEYKEMVDFQKNGFIE